MFLNLPALQALGMFLLRQEMSSPPCAPPSIVVSLLTRALKPSTLT
jgi:hypothetical protein